jgi:hypothetical protein
MQWQRPKFSGLAEKSMRASQIAGLATLIAALTLSTGCTRLRSHQGYIGDQTLLNSVQPGVDNKESVQASLGRPTFVGQFAGCGLAALDHRGFALHQVQTPRGFCGRVTLPWV